MQLCLVLKSLVGFLQHLHLLGKPRLVQFLALQKSATWDFVEPSYQGLHMFNLLILLFLKKIISIQTSKKTRVWARAACSEDNVLAGMLRG